MISNIFKADYLKAVWSVFLNTTQAWIFPMQAKSYRAKYHECFYHRITIQNQNVGYKPYADWFLNLFAYEQALTGLKSHITQNIYTNFIYLPFYLWFKFGWHWKSLLKKYIR